MPRRAGAHGKLEIRVFQRRVMFYPVINRDERMIHVHAVLLETDEGVAWAAVTGRVIRLHGASTR